MTDLFYGHFKDIPIVKVLKTRKVFSDSNFSRSILQPNIKKRISISSIKNTYQAYFQTVDRSCSLKFFLFFRFLLWYQMSALQQLQQKWWQFVWTMRRLPSHHFTDMQGRRKVQKWGRGLVHTSWSPNNKWWKCVGMGLNGFYLKLLTQESTKIKIVGAVCDLPVI